MTDDEFSEDLRYPPLPDWVRPGVKVREFYTDGHPNNTLWHVRAVFDNRTALRRWSRYKQRWIYEIREAWWFDGRHVNKG